MAELKIIEEDIQEQYSDGDSVEREIFDYVCSYSPEEYGKILETDHRWPVFYHLTDMREGILNWYDFAPGCDILEIGAGMGALTGLLCRNAGSVTSVELTLPRAKVIQERWKQYDNLTILVGNFNRMEFPKQYDYITLIGVLEYAPGFTPSGDPADFLKRIRSLLKPGGKLLLAIENRFGLKYWCGAAEDHTGKPFSGINGYPDDPKVCTYSRSELSNLLNKAGFEKKKFFYPLPDYKLPQVLYSDEYLPQNGLPIKVRQYHSNSDVLLTDEGKLYNTVFQNGAFPFMANSFFVECGGKNVSLSSVSAAFFTADRVPSSRVTTVIHGEHSVEKIASLPESEGHLCMILENQKHYSGDNLVPYIRKGNKLSMPFIKGESLDLILYNLMKNGNFREASQWIDRFYEVIKHSSENLSSGEDPLLHYGFLDLVFQNCIVQNDSLKLFDQEWFSESVPASYLLFRAIHVFYAEHPDVQVVVPVELIFRYYRFDKEKLKQYYQQEASFYSNVLLYKSNPLAIMDGFKAKDVDNLMEKQYTAKLYFDTGSGYMEELSEAISFSDGFIDMRCNIPANCISVRFDPVDGYYCAIRNLNVMSDHGYISYSNVNGETWNSMELFTNCDPQIELMPPSSTNWIRIRAEIYLFEDPIALNIVTELFNINELRREALTQADVLKEKKTIIEHQLLQSETARTDLVEQLSQSESVRTDLVEQLSQSESARTDLVEQLSQSESARTDLVEQLSQSESVRTDLVEQLSQSESARTDLVEQLSQAEIAQSDLEMQLSQTNTVRIQLEEIVSQTEDKNGNLQAQLNETISQRDYYTYAYNVISNAFFWKITKPARVIVDSFKKLISFNKESFRLLRKAFNIFQSRGIKGVRDQYRQRKIRLRNEKMLPVYSGNIPDNRPIKTQENLIEPVVPAEWIEIQREKPLISIIIAAKDLEERQPYLEKALNSLCVQLYRGFEVIIVADHVDYACLQNIVERYIGRLTIRTVLLEKQTTDQWIYWHKGVCEACGVLIGFLEQEDTLTENCLSYILEAYNEAIVRKWELYLIPDASYLVEDGTSISDWKVGAGWQVGGVESLLHFGAFEKAHYNADRIMFENWLLSLEREKIFVSPWIGCHGASVKNIWDNHRVRCIAFYLPQFHEIPENNKWWGEGFTEWINVKKAVPLYEGHHQPRVPGELGYYDLGVQDGLEVQKKQIALAKQYGIYGFCYYCYWFDGGKRLLEMPLDRHLQNKTIDFPFCLCWANENWTRQWDGLKNDIIMPQSYSPGWAENFILDMLPYLKDKRYICVNGAPFLLIYNLQDIPDPFEAISTWRKIAQENGIERLHISAVRRTPDSSELKISGYALDSLTDFPPHLLGIVGVDLDDARRFGLGRGQIKDYHKACKYHIEMPKQNYTYFRTAMLEWDNTARKGKDAYVFENFSFNDYQNWLYSAKRYALRQNRPGEDLVFINAWNEWAEGTYLEPSEPLGRAALEATKEALARR